MQDRAGALQVLLHTLHTGKNTITMLALRHATPGVSSVLSGSGACGLLARPTVLLCAVCPSLYACTQSTLHSQGRQHLRWEGMGAGAHLQQEGRDPLLP